MTVIDAGVVFTAALALVFPIVMIINLALTSLLASHYLVYCITRRDFFELLQKGRLRFLRSVWVRSIGSVFFSDFDFNCFYLP